MTNQQILFVISIGFRVCTQAQSVIPCTTSVKRFNGVCAESLDTKEVHYRDTASTAIQRFAFYVNGQIAYPPDLGCDFPFRCTTERSTPDTCLVGEARFMHGVYIVRDKQSRTWIEQRYEQGYIVEHIEYNGRTGRKRGRFEYLDSAWMTTDGVKVIMELFDEKTGDPTSRLRWVLQHGKWRWSR